MRTPRIVAAALIATVASGMSSCAREDAPSGAIEIETEDVTRFFEVYDAANGRPTADVLQHEYLDVGTAGLHHLADVRNVTGERIAQAILDNPERYADAKSCLDVLPRVRERLDVTFEALLDIYPGAQKPPVTIAVGRGRPLAIAGPGTGVQIGLEVMCSSLAARFFDERVDDRFVHVIAHEYIHAQQAPALAGTEELTVLERALVEGIAEFVGELISGGLANVGVARSAAGREQAIETRFTAGLDKRDLSEWFDNTTEEDVGQLGYWVGYRIAKAFYEQAPDKRAAVREMFQMTDARAFFDRSGWYPGIALP